MLCLVLDNLGVVELYTKDPRSLIYTKHADFPGVKFEVNSLTPLSKGSNLMMTVLNHKETDGGVVVTIVEPLENMKFVGNQLKLSKDLVLLEVVKNPFEEEEWAFVIA